MTYICKSCNSSFQVKEWRRFKPKYCSQQCYLARFGSAENRFWKLVNKTESCWLWIGRPSDNGYGKFFDGSHTTAHRFSYKLHFNQSPECVRHKCDVRLCVNPDHLIGGTQTDNIKDRDIRGRTHRGPKPNRIGKAIGLNSGSHTKPESRRKGVLNGMAKLTEQDVKEIRHEYCGKYGQLSMLGRKYGVSHVMISDIVSYKNWSHI